jgi:hypothetical protein
MTLSDNIFTRVCMTGAPAGGGGEADWAETGPMIVTTEAAAAALARSLFMTFASSFFVGQPTKRQLYGA